MENELGITLTEGMVNEHGTISMEVMENAAQNHWKKVSIINVIYILANLLFILCPLQHPLFPNIFLRGNLNLSFENFHLKMDIFQISL